MLHLLSTEDNAYVCKHSIYFPQRQYVYLQVQDLLFNKDSTVYVYKFFQKMGLSMHTNASWRWVYEQLLQTYNY